MEAPRLHRLYRPSPLPGQSSVHYAMSWQATREVSLAPLPVDEYGRNHFEDSEGNEYFFDDKGGLVWVTDSLTLPEQPEQP